MNNFDRADRLQYLTTCYDKFELARKIMALEERVKDLQNDIDTEAKHTRGRM